jgi:hypothetical protein
MRDAMPGYFPGWDVTLGSWGLDLNATKVVQIGHAPPIPETFRAQSIELPVLLWVNEAEHAEAVNDMYLAISFDAGTPCRQMADAGLITRLTVLAVGPRQEGPTGFIAADLTWFVQVANT